MTAKLNMRAYAFVSDVVDALGDALFVAAPQHFKLESAVSANELLGTLSIRSERSPFRLLMMDGPTCNTSLHRHLGFGNTPFKAHSYSIDSKVNEQNCRGINCLLGAKPAFTPVGLSEQQPGAHLHIRATPGIRRK